MPPEEFLRVFHFVLEGRFDSRLRGVDCPLLTPWFKRLQNLQTIFFSMLRHS
jgi:hypothetical protein